MSFVDLCVLDSATKVTLPVIFCSASRYRTYIDNFSGELWELLFFIFLKSIESVLYVCVGFICVGLICVTQWHWSLRLSVLCRSKSQLSL